MKKKLFCILLSLAMVVTMMPMMTFTAFAGEDEPTAVEPGDMVLSELIVEGWSVAETKEKLILYYKTLEGQYEKYNKVNYYFYKKNEEQNYVKLTDDHIFTENETINIVMVIEAPEGRHFKTAYYEEGGFHPEVNMPFDFEQIKVSGRGEFNEVQVGTGFNQQDGSLSTEGFNEEDYKKASTDAQREALEKDLKYIRIAGTIDVTSQWTIFGNIFPNDKIPEMGDRFNERCEALYQKFFKTEKLGETVYKITLLHDMKNKKENNSTVDGLLTVNLINEKAATFIVDLNGYTIDANFANKPTNEYGNGGIFRVSNMDGLNSILIIEDSSKEKTGKITGVNNLSSGAIINQHTLIINGGTITLNNGEPLNKKPIGGGITNRGNLYIGGSAKIIGNTADSKTSNILCTNGGKIFIGDGTNMEMNLPEGYIVEKPAAGFKVGVSQESGGKFLYNAKEKDAKYFSSDDTDYYVAYNSADGGYLELKALGDGEKPVSGYQSENGTVYIDPQAATPGQGTMITVTIAPKAGYEIDGRPVVYGADGEPLDPQPDMKKDAEDPNVFTFVVPEGVDGITVKADFKVSEKDNAKDKIAKIVKGVAIAAAAVAVVGIIGQTIKNVQLATMQQQAALRAQMQQNLLQRQVAQIKTLLSGTTVVLSLVSFGTSLRNLFSLGANQFRFLR